MNEDVIYQTVPQEYLHNDDCLGSVVSFFRENKGKFFTATKISKEVGLDTKGSCVSLRKIITALIVYEQMPIVSNSKGFAFVDSPNMMRVSIEQDEFRLEGLLRRINAKRRILEKMRDDEDGEKRG